MGNIFQNLLGSSKDALASQAIQESINSGIELQSAAEKVAGDDADTIHAQAEEKLNELESDLSDLATEQDDMDGDGMEDAVAEIADAYGLDKEVVMDMLEEAQRMQEEMDEPPEDPEEDPEADDEPPEQEGGVSEERVSALEEQLAELQESIPDGDLATAEEVQSTVEDALEGVATSEQLEEQLQGLGESISDNIGEHIESQMATGSTPGPTGGGADVQNLESEMKEWADEITPDGSKAGGD